MLHNQTNPRHLGQTYEALLRRVIQACGNRGEACSYLAERFLDDDAIPFLRRLAILSDAELEAAVRLMDDRDAKKEQGR